jgi:hypothetical protein
MRRWVGDWLAAAGLGAVIGLAAVAPAWLTPPREKASAGRGDARPVDVQRPPRAAGEQPCPDQARPITTAAGLAPAVAQAAVLEGARNPTTCGSWTRSNREKHHE